MTGSATGQKYRIHVGVSGNVQEIGEDGAPNRSWCFHARNPLLLGDVKLAQKIALETNECAALAVANHFLFDGRSRQSLLKTAPRSTTRDIPGANDGNLVVDNLKMGGCRPNHWSRVWPWALRDIPMDIERLFFVTATSLIIFLIGIGLLPTSARGL